jgi:hypothetical protein
MLLHRKFHSCQEFFLYQVPGTTLRHCFPREKTYLTILLSKLYLGGVLLIYTERDLVFQSSHSLLVWINDFDKFLGEIV